MIALKNVLVGTDFSDTSHAALKYGRELAAAFGARLHLLHVTDDVALRFAAGPVPAMLPDFQRQVDDTAWARLEAQLTPDDRSKLDAETVVRTAPDIARGIIKYAEEADIDLIVLGTHGRRLIPHALLGSVAERVVRTAPCPVLTVRHPEREFIGAETTPSAPTARMPNGVQ